MTYLTYLYFLYRLDNKLDCCLLTIYYYNSIYDSLSNIMVNYFMTSNFSDIFNGEL